MRLGALALSLAAAVLPVGAAAGDVLVLLDSSKSIERLTRTYRDDILAILEASPERVFFAPIGDTASQGVLIDSYAPPDERRNLVNGTFRFADVYTKIDGSLQAVERDPRFGNVDRIFVVSDMEPDFDNVGPWSFNNQDLVDLQAFLDRLGSWASSRQKKVTLVLHGWSAVPVLSDQGDQNVDDFPKEIQWRIAHVPQSGGNLEGRGLVARGLLRLQRDHPQIEMRAIPTVVEGETNEEEFRDVLCSSLAIKDPEVCWTYEAEKTRFQMRVDFDRRLLLPAELRDSLRNAGDVKIAVGPPRTIQLATIANSLAADHDPAVDFHFRVRAGTQGKPFYNPVLSATLKKEDGTVETAGTVFEPARDLTSEEEMVTWVNNEIGNALRTLITEHFPPVSKLKRIDVIGPDGRPLATGYRVQVRLDYSDPSAKPFLSKTKETREDAPVSFQLPTYYDRGVVQLKTRLTERGEWIDGPVVELHQLGKNAVKRRSSITFQVDDSITRPFEVTHAGDPSVRFRFEVFLRTPADKDPPIYVGEVVHGTPHSFRLLPGSYRWEAVPLDSPNLLAVTGREEVDYPVEPPRSLELTIRDDPLADETSWNTAVPSLIQLGSLTGDAIDVVNRSAKSLRALYRFTSNRLEAGDTTDLEDIWQAFQDVLFDPHEQGTMERRLERALREVGLSTAEGGVSPNAYIFAQATFNIFIARQKAEKSAAEGEDASVAERGADRYDSHVSGDSESAIALRQEYNAWLDRITDFNPGDNLISPELRDRLRAEK